MTTTRITLAVLLVALATTLVVSLCLVGTAAAAAPEPQSPDCATCHADRAKQWQTSKHAAAFGDAVFKKAWDEGKNQAFCLTCHTTGFDPKTEKYAQEGVGCTACHQPAGIASHPGGAMTVKDSADFCGTCHTTTLHEWQKGGHGKANVACRSCHDMHSTNLRTTESGDLCINCHKERNVQTANMPMTGAGQCANCHMFSLPDSKVEGKGATGHSFVMGGDACQRCHKDDIHQSHQVTLTSEPQPGTDKLIKPTTSTPAVAAERASSAGGLTGILGGGLGGLLIGFAASFSVIRRSK